MMHGTINIKHNSINVQHLQLSLPHIFNTNVATFPEWFWQTEMK